MSKFLNIFNFVFLGFLTTLGWLFVTAVSILLIVTLPYTRGCWEITKMSLAPFGKDIIHVKYLEETSSVANGLGTVLNIVWFILFGWWLAILHLTTGIAQCLTIIGIPCGLANFKLIPVSLSPVGIRVVPIELAQDIRLKQAQGRYYKR